MHYGFAEQTLSSPQRFSPRQKEEKNKGKKGLIAWSENERKWFGEGRDFGQTYPDPNLLV